MQANHHQVGGAHYRRGKIQHWDWAVQVLANSYLEGNLTKYTSRHRFKGVPLADLEKGMHYLDKLAEEFLAKRVQSLWVRHQARNVEHGWLDEMTRRFTLSADLNPLESSVMWRTAMWRGESDLVAVQVAIRDLIQATRS